MAQIIREDQKSKVDSDALIYQKRDDTNSKEAYEQLDAKGKFQFFKDYYLETILIVAAAVIIGGYFLYQTMTKPQTILYIAISDDTFDDDKIAELEHAAATYLGLNEKKEVVKINTNFRFQDGQLNKQLQDYIYAGSCDMVIAPEEAFRNWAQAGYFCEPDTFDCVSVFQECEEEDRLYCQVFDGETVRGEKEGDAKKYNFGVSVRDCRKYQELGGKGASAYVGITNSSKHQEEAAAFLRFLLDDQLKDGDVSPEFDANQGTE